MVSHEKAPPAKAFVRESKPLVKRRDKKWEVVERVIGGGTERSSVHGSPTPSPSAPLPVGGENWGLDRYGWWLIEKYVGGELEGSVSRNSVPVSVPSSWVESHPEEASKLAVALGDGAARGPTGLADLCIPGWGDPRVLSFIDGANPPPRCLGLLPPAPPPPGPRLSPVAWL